ncbi:MAG: STAS/SEC14 domain-containing protein [Rhizobiaceae bacterium]|nr:STAS/SEC14 domain-containing protein [Rhizobiaceae bacterium]
MSLHPLEPIPAVRRLDTNRSALLAVEIAGHVSANDIENLYGLLEGAYSLHERIDLFIRVVDHDGADWSEVSSETVADARSHAEKHIARCATVGDRRATARMAEIFCPSNAEHRHFESEDEAAAWAWLDAREQS